jgi:hypothetical protein
MRINAGEKMVKRKIFGMDRTLERDPLSLTLSVQYK